MRGRLFLILIIPKYRNSLTNNTGVQGGVSKPNVYFDDVFIKRDALTVWCKQWQREHKQTKWLILKIEVYQQIKQIFLDIWLYFET